MIKKGDVVACKNKGDFRCAVLKDLLNLLVSKGVIELANAKSKRTDKTALADTLDISSNNLVHKLIKSRLSNLNGFSAVNDRIIKPLYLFLDEEVLLYARLKKLKFKQKKTEKDKISSFINSLESKHPEIKRAIVSSYLKLYG